MLKKSKPCCEKEKKAMGPAPVPGFGDPNRRNDPARMAAIKKTRERVTALRQNTKPAFANTEKSVQVFAPSATDNSLFHVVELVKGEESIDWTKPGAMKQFNAMYPEYNGSSKDVSYDDHVADFEGHAKKKLGKPSFKPNADAQANRMSVKREGKTASEVSLDEKSISKKKKVCCKGLAGLMDIAKGF